MDEKRWLYKISQGDRNAFTKLLHLHEAGLTRYAGYFLRDKDMAQDAVQETFLRVWRYREKYKECGSERAYLLRLLKNVCCDLLNSHATEQVELATEELINLSLNNEQENGFSSAVDKAIEQLPVEQREVFMFSHFEGFSYLEIAQLLGCSKGTVASRKRLAVESLRRHLYGWRDENEL